MKSDLAKLLILVWMSIMVFFIFNIWQDVHYLTDLVHAYISMAMEMIRQ